ncbi:MAG: hydrolase [Variovorax sp.]|nr:MAG: hydrolase [Variovorax sp.]
MNSATGSMERRGLRIVLGNATTLEADLGLPRRARGLVLFAHGSGSSRFSPRNREVAGQLNDAGLATVLVDLLTPDEEAIDERSRQLRFDIALLADRLVGLTDWLRVQDRTASLNLGYFGASTGAAAALMAAAQRPDATCAVVSRGGRPDLAGQALRRVRAPTLLIVGGNDGAVIDMNRHALELLRGPKQLSIVPGATHLFAETGALSAVSTLALDWFLRHLVRPL